MARTKEFSASLMRLEELTQLELLKLEGFPNEEEEIVFAKRLLPERTVIIAKSPANGLRLLERVPKLGKYLYKFKMLKDEVYPDHSHMNL
ncbi:hypothetical protein REPUB_Repub13aG0073500 [Reevesia pubescens]